MGVFGYFGGSENGTWGAQITPLKPLFRHLGSHFGPRKSDFCPFLLILVIFPLKFPLKPKFFGEGLPIELERKQKLAKEMGLDRAPIEF